MKNMFRACMAALLMVLGLAPGVMAAEYPARPITIIVPYGAGDGPDVIARLIGDHISKSLDQAVVIENRPGASGQIGLTQTARAKPDGYTLGVGLVTNLGLAPYTYKSLPYDPLKDFEPVALASMNYLALVARPDAPFKTVEEMIQWAKDNPGELSIGTTSMCGLPHMSFERLAHMSGFTFLNVPYKSNSAVAADLTGGRTDLAVTSYTSVAALVNDGRLRLLGITYPERDPSLPDLPTIAESVEGYDAVGWFGFVAPAGTPADIVSKLNQTINDALGVEQVKETMGTLGLIPVVESPEYFAELLERENEAYRKLVEDIGYEPR